MELDRCCRDLCCQPLWGYSPVTIRNQFGYFVPVDFTNIQTERDPSSWSDIGRKIEPVRAGRGERSVVTRHHLAAHGDNTVAMMIVKVVDKRLFPDMECGVVSMALPGGFGQRKADLGKPGEARVFLRSFGHIPSNCC